MYASLFHYPKFLWPLASVLGFVAIMVSVPVWGSLMLLLVALGASRDIQTRMIRAWLMFVTKSFGLRYEIVGAENFNPNQPSLVVSNHQSLFDIPAAFAALPGHLRMVAKKELFALPFFGWCLSRTEFISVDRGNRQSGLEASKKISHRIKSGLHIWVAPEGTRSPDGNLLPFKKGSFSVAIEAQIPVQPILVADSRLACPKGSLLVRPGTVIRVFVLPRVETKGYQPENRGVLAEKVRGHLQEAFLKMNSLS
jgi:1-acyl-sn-glycerol-3-phosphate acyltransferase